MEYIVRSGLEELLALPTLLHNKGGDREGREGKAKRIERLLLSTKRQMYSQKPSLAGKEAFHFRPLERLLFARPPQECPFDAHPVSNARFL